MKMRTKILSAALFAGILFMSMDAPETEMRAFALSAPSSALLEASLIYAASNLEVEKVDAQFIRLAQR